MSTPAQAVLAAIKTRYDSAAGDAIRSAGCTGLYVGRAPQSAVYPYIVLTIPAASSDPTVGQGTSAAGLYDDIDIQAGCFDSGEEGANIVRRSPNRGMSIMGAYVSAFNFADLTLASPFRLVDGHKTLSVVPIEEPDQKGWHCVTTFVYNVAG